ncbi:hypothetical protein WUBG_18932, partial [Wuchereria bancrofti]
KIARDWNVIWDFAEEEKPVEENVLWLSAPMTFERNSQKICKIKTTGLLLETNLMKKMLDAKSVFDELDMKDLKEARIRANPYETIGSAFFQNR